MDKVVFLDRDGTINEEMGYINHISRFQIFDFAPSAIRIINQKGYKAVVITNQSGIARGYFTEKLLTRVHAKLEDTMKSAGAHIDRIYYCPHHPTEGKGEYLRDCSCRKPKTGMIDLARKEFDIDMAGSIMIGDRFKDMEFGKKLGLTSIMVLTGYGLGEYTYQSDSWPFQPDHICKNLYEAALLIRDLT